MTKFTEFAQIESIREQREYQLCVWGSHHQHKRARPDLT